MQIVQISDTHLSKDHPERALTLEAAVAAINAKHPDADAVVHTGDISHNGLFVEFDAARQIMSGLKAPFFVMPGNKDDRSVLQEVFADQSYISQGSPFIQYAVETFDHRLIMLDTVSAGNSMGEYCSQRLSHLDELLKQQPTRSTTVFMHHIPFKADPAPDPFQFQRWEEVEALGELLNAHSQVQQIFCGHIHRTMQGMLGQLQVSALTCMAIDLRKGELSESEKTEPVFALRELD